MSQLTQREREVLALVRDDPLISQQAIADALKISRSAVAGHIMKLTDKGAIRGRGYVVTDGPFVVAIGGANMDVTGSPLQKLKARDSNPGIVRTSPGGVARNIAENLARLNVNCRLIAALGSDQYGDLLARHGRESGIDMRHVVRLEQHATSTYLSVLDDTGDMLTAISDMTILDALDASILEKSERILRQASAIVVDLNVNDSALAFLTSEFAHRPIVVDTVSTTKAPRIRPYLAKVHSIFPNLKEAEALSGLPGNTKRQRQALARWFHDQGVTRVFISLGKQGVLFSEVDEQDTLLPPRHGAALNANGAGDAFTAAAVAAWLEHRPLAECAQFAMAAANHTLRDTATVSASLSRDALQALCEEHYAH